MMIRMKKYHFIFLLLFFFSCNQNKEKALSYINKAQNLYENAEYGSAKQVLDELKITYPKEVFVQKEALNLMRKIEVGEQTRNLAFCDSMIIVLQTEINSLKSSFLFEKSEYDTSGRYIDKNYNPQPGHASKYMKIQVNESGDLVLTSVYQGTPIKHNQIKVSIPSGEFAETETIPFDGGNNYSFTDLGITYELVTFQKGRDNGVAQFIYNFADKKITLEYLGEKKTSSYVLSEKEKKTLINSVNFAVALKELSQFQIEKEKSEKRLEYLKGKYVE